MKKNCHTNQGPIFASVNREVSTVKSNLVGTDSLNYKKQDAEKLTRLRLSLDDKKVANMRLKGNVRIQRAIYQSKSVHHANNLTGTSLYWAAGFICTLSRFRNWKKMGTETFFSETWTFSTASRKQTLTKNNNLIKNIWKLRKVLNLTCSACKASWNSGNRFSYSEGSARESAAFLLTFAKSSFHNWTILKTEQNGRYTVKVL